MSTSPSRALVARGEQMVAARNDLLRACVRLLEEREATLRPVDRVVLRSALQASCVGFWDDEEELDK